MRENELHHQSQDLFEEIQVKQELEQNILNLGVLPLSFHPSNRVENAPAAYRFALGRLLHSSQDYLWSALLAIHFQKICNASFLSARFFHHLRHEMKLLVYGSDVYWIEKP